VALHSEMGSSVQDLGAGGPKADEKKMLRKEVVQSHEPFFPFLSPSATLPSLQWPAPLRNPSQPPTP